VTDPRSRGTARAEEAGTPRRRGPVAGRRAAARRALEARAGSAGAGTVTAQEVPAEQPAEAANGAQPAAPAAAPADSAVAPVAATGESQPVLRARLSRPVKVLVVLALVLAVVALTALGLVGYQSWQNSRLDSARTQALAAAQRSAPDILSYDYRQLEQDFDKAKNHLTGDFAKEYDATTSKGVAPVATQYKAVVKAEVIASSVVSVKADEVVTLLFVNQTTTSTRVEGPKIDQNRVRMTLTKVDGEWKVSRVDAL
jgi:Mce-associated membrane protein